MHVKFLPQLHLSNHGTAQTNTHMHTQTTSFDYQWPAYFIYYLFYISFQGLCSHKEINIQFIVITTEFRLLNRWQFIILSLFLCHFTAHTEKVQRKIRDTGTSIEKMAVHEFFKPGEVFWTCHIHTEQECGSEGIYISGLEPLKCIKKTL